jgi:hypothetical protein
MRFRADESGDLGPVVSVAAPSPREADETTSTKVNEDGALHLGNASFDRVAESLNLRPTGATKANDLSRQFGSAPAARNVASSVSIDGWAIIGILALVLIVGMAIGFYENDRDDRQRRKKNRRRRHRHSS